MMKERILITALCMTLVSFGWAEAQRAPNVNRSGPHIRANKSPISSSVASRGSRVSAPRIDFNRGRSSARPMGTNKSPRGVNVSGVGSLNRSGLGSHGGAGGLGNNSPFGGLLQQYLYNEYGGGNFDPYAGQKAQAKAYRDAAIANAVVNVVGILATSQQQRQYGAACPPAPAPRGYVERKQVLVQEGRTEEYQVWVPQYTIPETGEVVVGHHETRRRNVAPVYEIREVWVPTP